MLKFIKSYIFFETQSTIDKLQPSLNFNKKNELKNYFLYKNIRKFLGTQLSTPFSIRKNLVNIPLIILCFYSCEKGDIASQETVNSISNCNAADYGFLPNANPEENAISLQKALNDNDVVEVNYPGIYAIDTTIILKSNNKLYFKDGVYIKKVKNKGNSFGYTFINKGATTKTYDQNITIKGLKLIINGLDGHGENYIQGLNGHLSFFYIKNLIIENFECLDIGTSIFAIHICTFDNITLNRGHIKGKKDAIHLGRGKKFIIQNYTFNTFDDPIALNAQDYDVSNPQVGWIEDGIVENCIDLSENPIGYFCRILAGGFVDWYPGIKLQKSDIIIHNNRMYRVIAEPDGKIYTSQTPPNHLFGLKQIDGINWLMIQDDITYTAGVRNVCFKNLAIETKRLAVFSLHFDNDNWSRSYYPGAEIPIQNNLRFENITIKSQETWRFISCRTPINSLYIRNSYLKCYAIDFIKNSEVKDFKHTNITFDNCTFAREGTWDIIANEIPDKTITLKTFGSRIDASDFQPQINGPGISIDSDLF